MRRIFIAISALLVLVATGLAVVLVPPHLQLRGITPSLPDDSELRSLLSVPKGPTQISTIRSSQQERDGGSFGHSSVVIEWANGRNFVIDLAMDEAATIDFSELMAMMGNDMTLEFNGSVATQLGDTIARVDGVGFTHLHTDHVQGIARFCAKRGTGASVVWTAWQSSEHNLHTVESAEQVKASCLAQTVLDGEGLLSVEGFPGLGVVGLGGHTPGSTLFVVPVGGTLWLMVGDTTNVKKDLLENRGKGLLYSGFLVPENTARTEALRLWFARLDNEPDMKVVVSHDLGAAAEAGLPAFPPQGFP